MWYTTFMRKIIFFLNGFAAIATLGVMLYAGQPWKEGLSIRTITWLVAFFVFGAWAVSPYWCLYYNSLKTPINAV